MNKYDYITYRSNWKQAYKALTITIRELTWIRKESQRIFSKAMKTFDVKYRHEFYYNNNITKIRNECEFQLSTNKKYQELYNKYEKLAPKSKDGLHSYFYPEIEIMKNAKKATEMLEELKLMKLKSY